VGSKQTALEHIDHTLGNPFPTFDGSRLGEVYSTDDACGNPALLHLGTVAPKP